MPSPAAKPALKKPLPLTPPKLTEAEQQRLNKLREYGRKGGLANKKKPRDYLQDKGKAFEIIREKWIALADVSVDEALRAVRDDKTDPKQLVGKVTAGAIGFDKAFKGHTDDSTEIDIPASLATQIGAKLSKPLISNESENMIQGKSCNSGEQSVAEPEPPLDPMLLSPGL